eukprot:254245_1
MACCSNQQLFHQFVLSPTQRREILNYHTDGSIPTQCNTIKKKELFITYAIKHRVTPTIIAKITSRGHQIIPECSRLMEIFKYFHSKSHWKHIQMIKSITEIYEINNIHKFTKYALTQCDVCNDTEKYIQSTGPYTVILMDWCGPLPLSK